MKKLALSLVAALAIFAVACGGGSPKDKAISLTKEFAEKLEKNPQDADKLGKEYQDEMKKIEDGLSEEEKEKLGKELLQDKEFQKALGDLMGSAMKAGMQQSMEESAGK